MEKTHKLLSCRGKCSEGEPLFADPHQSESRTSSSSNDTGRVSSRDYSSSSSSSTGGSVTYHHLRSSPPNTGHTNNNILSISNGKKLDPLSYARVHLRDMRVVRRDLCYVVGLPLEVVADEAALKDFTYFGKYGRVLNVIVNRNPNFKSPDKKRSCAVYVTFSDRSEAIAAIQDLNERLFEGRRLRASYGTTKYCSSFLKNARCQNRQCFYLHEKGADEDSFTVDELNQVKEQSQTLTCSALLANEFQTSQAKKEICFFGMSYSQLIDYYVSNEEGRKATNVLPSVALKVAAVRSGSRPAATEESTSESTPEPPPPESPSSVEQSLAPEHTGGEENLEHNGENSSSVLLLPPPPARWATIVHPLLQQSWTLVMPPSGGGQRGQNIEAGVTSRNSSTSSEMGTTPPPPPSSMVEYSVAPVSSEQAPHSPPSLLMHCKGVTTADQVARRLTPCYAGLSMQLNPPPGFNAR